MAKQPRRMQSATTAADAWQAESARLTAFPSENLDVSGITWWNDLLKTPTDKQELREKSGVRIEQGDFENGRLILSVQPGRIDWTFLPRVDPNNLPDGLPLLGVFPDATQRFFDLMYRWLKSAPKVRRLAFGATLMIPVDNAAQANRRIAHYVPLNTGREKGNLELIFRMNRPARSKVVPSLIFQRLPTWSTAVIHTIMLTGVQPPAPQRTYHACRLELDLSTPPDAQHDLPHRKLVPLFQELVKLGCEVAEKGDKT